MKFKVVITNKGIRVQNPKAKSVIDRFEREALFTTLDRLHRHLDKIMSPLNKKEKNAKKKSK